MRDGLPDKRFGVVESRPVGVVGNTSDDRDVMMLAQVLGQRGRVRTNASTLRTVIDTQQLKIEFLALADKCFERVSHVTMSGRGKTSQNVLFSCYLSSSASSMPLRSPPAKESGTEGRERALPLPANYV